MSFLIISNSEIAYPRFSEPNVLLVMSEQARTRTKNYETKEIMKLDINDFVDKFKDLKIEKFSYNIFFLGLITKFLVEKNILKTEQVFGLLEKKLSKKVNWTENERTWKLAIEN